MKRHRGIRRILVAGFALLLAGVVLPGGARADAPMETHDIMVSTNARLPFDKDVSRVAVADPEIVESQTLTTREILLLGRKPGRTTVIVWFADGTTASYLYRVTRDLTLLDEALKEIHPSITAQTAPDRDAVVLRGLVPDISYSNAAEDAAQRYLNARQSRQVAPPAVRPAMAPAVAPNGSPLPTVESTGNEVVPTGQVINLIRVQSLPGRLEDRMRDAIRAVGAANVTVHRLVKDRLPDDEHDVFVLEGSVASQVELVRVLSVAQSLLGGQRGDDIQVRADESGALASASAGAAAASPQGTSSLSQLFGGSSSTRLDNEVGKNIARAKVVEAAHGRILSFLDVRDLPQVRVDIRLYEVNSSKLRQARSNLAVLLSNFSQPSLNPASGANAAQGGAAARVGSQGKSPDVQNVLGFLAGTVSNQFQLSGDNAAVDWLFSVLETKGWARSLSRPSLAVLSGERAFFQVGGEVPVPEAFATTATGSTNQGVLNSVVFKPFGVQLAVRPLVGDEGDITLDVAPQISMPDAQLTDAIRQSTGSQQSTTAFSTRYLQTTARLDDGQALLIGGLLSRNVSVSRDGTPGLADLPLVGGLFRSDGRQGDEIQLVIVVHPVVERKPCAEARLWAMPGVTELMRSVRASDQSALPCPQVRPVQRQP